MLMDVLGIIIGFVTIVLLLSILVTGAVQTAASFWHRRHKALKLGIADSNLVEILRTVIGGISSTSEESNKELRKFIDIVEREHGLSPASPLSEIVENNVVNTSIAALKEFIGLVSEAKAEASDPARIEELFVCAMRAVNKLSSQISAKEKIFIENESQALKTVVDGLVIGKADERVKKLPALITEALTTLKSKGEDSSVPLLYQILDLVEGASKPRTAQVSEWSLLGGQEPETKTRPVVQDTWIEDKEVIEPLKAAGASAAAVASVQLALDRTRQVMDDKYLQWARGLTFVFSLFVAFYFQASVPDLLTKLQSDAALRERAETVARETLDQGSSEEPGADTEEESPNGSEQDNATPPAAGGGSSGGTGIGTEANDSGSGSTTTAPPDNDASSNAAESPANTNSSATNPNPTDSQKPVDEEALKKALSDLALLGIKPMENWEFYRSRNKDNKVVTHWDNVFGVLFMAVLMSFGAPFWYRMLKELIGLKDALRKKEDTESTSVSGDGAKEASAKA